MSLTFDPDSYGSLRVADLVGGGADVFADVVERGLGDVDHLVEVPDPHPRLHRQPLSIFGPGDVGRRPVQTQRHR